MKMQALWRGVVLAESAETLVVEGNHYFPPDAIRSEYISESSRKTVCPWKGTASYYDVRVQGEDNPGAAWFYPDPLPEAKAIQGYIAFWQGIQVRKAE